jgi:hypothetical protein
VCAADPADHGTGGCLAVVLDARGRGARALVTGLATLPPPHAPGHGGIGYLGLLVAELRRRTARQVRLADARYAGLAPRPAVAVLTGGRPRPLRLDGRRPGLVLTVSR